MKKILAAILAVMMMLTLVACGSSDAPEAPESEAPEAEAPEAEAPEAEGEAEGEAAEADPKLTEALEAMKEIYGENYIPAMPIEPTMLNEIYGITMENVESFVGEMPMMSSHVDTFIGIKAAADKADAVEEELNAYRDYLVNESMQYPMNIEKVNASKVVRKGDYVFFVMLGAIPETEDEGFDYAGFYTEQNKLGLDKLDELFA